MKSKELKSQFFSYIIFYPNLHYIFIQHPQNYPATSEIYGCGTDIHTPHNTVPACVLVAEMTSWCHRTGVSGLQVAV